VRVVDGQNLAGVGVHDDDEVTGVSVQVVSRARATESKALLKTGTGVTFVDTDAPA
jgi:hypothetical protein